MAVLIVDTPLTLTRDGTRLLGPFPIDDAARSILITAARQAWPTRVDRRTSRVVFQAVLELSVDGGDTWQHAGSLGAEGGIQERVRDSGIDAPENMIRIGLQPGVNRVGRVAIQSAEDFTTVVRVENSVTIGTPNNATGFGAAMTVSVDAGSGSDRVVFGFLNRNSRTFASMTFNLVAGTSVAAAGDLVSVHEFIAPATGSSTLAAATIGDTNFSIGGVPTSGTDQTTPSNGAQTATGSGNTISVAAVTTGATGDIVLDSFSVSHTGGGSTSTPGAAQTAQIDNENFAGAYSFGVSSEAGAASVTMGWTCTNGGSWGIVAFNVKAAGAGAPAHAPRHVLVSQAVNRASRY